MANTQSNKTSRIRSSIQLSCCHFMSSLLLAYSSCAVAAPETHESCQDTSVSAENCPPANAIDDAFINDLAKYRTWVPAKELSDRDLDPVQFSTEAEIRISPATGKLITSSPEDSRSSIVAKLWMIENALHTVDLTYYIFRKDLAGQAVLAALCDAVKRGVDVRFMMDATGSVATASHDIDWLLACAREAGWMINAEGELTTQRARVQILTFNSLTNLSASPNRRSHDKLLITDGLFPERAYIMTGGRNVALDYYGFDDEGNVDPAAYRDAEILLRPQPNDDGLDLGQYTNAYYSLLWLFQGNRHHELSERKTISANTRKRQADAYSALERFKSLPLLQPQFADIDAFMNEGFSEVQARIAFNMGNLENKRVVRNVKQNLEANPNAILYIIGEIGARTDGSERARLASPYLFLANYREKDGTVILDEAESLLRWLEDNPEARIEIITNSIMTSDNFPAQAVIDFNTAPRLLLTPEMQEQWLKLSHDEEASSELVNSQAWKMAVTHPRLAVYETGMLDSALFPGGLTTYGKLHAKFWQKGGVGFVGTSNFDYRSRIYNNEVGYFFQGDELSEDLVKEFELLKSMAYRWGSPEWLEMRAKVMKLDGMKGTSSRRQRTIYKTLKATGLIWLF